MSNENNNIPIITSNMAKISLSNNSSCVVPNTNNNTTTAIPSSMSVSTSAVKSSTTIKPNSRPLKDKVVERFP